MYNITEEQIKDIAQGGGKSKIKQMFPQVFETKLEVGEWYKSSDLIGCYSGNGWCYGAYGRNKRNWGGWCMSNGGDDYRPATAKEVEEALIQEAKKRYGEDWQSVKIKEHADKEQYEWSITTFKSGMESERLFGRNGVLFYKGKWAEILSEPKVITKTEAENRLQDLTGEKFKIREEQPDRCEHSLLSWAFEDK